MEPRAAADRSVPARAGMAVKPVRIIARPPSGTEIAIAVAAIITGTDEHAAVVAAVIGITAIIGTGIIIIGGIAAIAGAAVTIPGRIGITAGKRGREAKSQRNPGWPDAIQNRYDEHDMINVIRSYLITSGEAVTKSNCA
jgi:hypothetical protein